MLKLIILQADTQDELIRYFDKVMKDLNLTDIYVKDGNFHRDKGIYYYAFMYNANDAEARDIDEYFKNVYTSKVMMKAKYLSTSKAQMRKELQQQEQQEQQQ